MGKIVIVRKDQFRAFSERSSQTFVERMVDHLQSNFGEHLEQQRIAPDQLDAFVREGIASAKPHGVVSEFDVRIFLECRVLLGRNFDSDPSLPWAGEILRRKYMSPAARMAALDEHLTFHQAGHLQ